MQTIKSEIISPYISIVNNEARISLRIKDFFGKSKKKRSN